MSGEGAGGGGGADDSRMSNEALVDEIDKLMRGIQSQEGGGPALGLAPAPVPVEEERASLLGTGPLLKASTMPLDEDFVLATAVTADDATEDLVPAPQPARRASPRRASFAMDALSTPRTPRTPYSPMRAATIHGSATASPASPKGRSRRASFATGLDQGRDEVHDIIRAIVDDDHEGGPGGRPAAVRASTPSTRGSSPNTRPRRTSFAAVLEVVHEQNESLASISEAGGGAAAAAAAAASSSGGAAVDESMGQSLTIREVETGLSTIPSSAPTGRQSCFTDADTDGPGLVPPEAFWRGFEASAVGDPTSDGESGVGGVMGLTALEAARGSSDPPLSHSAFGGGPVSCFAKPATPMGQAPAGGGGGSRTPRGRSETMASVLSVVSFCDDVDVDVEDRGGARAACGSQPGSPGSPATNGSQLVGILKGRQPSKGKMSRQAGGSNPASPAGGSSAPTSPNTVVSIALARQASANAGKASDAQAVSGPAIAPDPPPPRKLSDVSPTEALELERAAEQQLERAALHFALEPPDDSDDDASSTADECDIRLHAYTCILHQQRRYLDGLTQLIAGYTADPSAGPRSGGDAPLPPPRNPAHAAKSELLRERLAQAQDDDGAWRRGWDPVRWAESLPAAAAAATRGGCAAGPAAAAELPPRGPDGIAQRVHHALQITVTPVSEEPTTAAGRPPPPRSGGEDTHAPPAPDGDAIIACITAVDDTREWGAVLRAYQTMYPTAPHGGGLLKTLREELSPKELAACKAALSAKGVDFYGGARGCSGAGGPAPAAGSGGLDSNDAVHAFPSGSGGGRPVPLPPARLAHGLYRSLRGLDAWDDAVFGELDSVVSPAHWAAVKLSFAEMYPGYYGGNVVRALVDDLDDTDLAICEGVLRKVGVELLAGVDAATRATSLALTYRPSAVAGALYTVMSTGDGVRAAAGTPDDTDTVGRHINRVQDAAHWGEISAAFTEAYPEFYEGDIARALRRSMAPDDLSACEAVLSGIGVALPGDTAASTTATAGRMYRALAAVPTLRDEVYATLEGVKDTAAWKDVGEVFAARHPEFHGGDIVAALQAVLSPTELAKCAAILQCNSVDAYAAGQARPAVAPPVDQLHAAVVMEPCPDEEAVFTVLSQLASQDEYDALDAAYREEHLRGRGGELVDVLRARLSAELMKACERMLVGIGVALPAAAQVVPGVEYDVFSGTLRDTKSRVFPDREKEIAEAFYSKTCGSRVDEAGIIALCLDMAGDPTVSCETVADAFRDAHPAFYDGELLRVLQLVLSNHTLARCEVVLNTRRVTLRADHGGRELAAALALGMERGGPEGNSAVYTALCGIKDREEWTGAVLHFAEWHPSFHDGVLSDAITACVAPNIFVECESVLGKVVATLKPLKHAPSTPDLDKTRSSRLSTSRYDEYNNEITVCERFYDALHRIGDEGLAPSEVLAELESASAWHALVLEHRRAYASWLDGDVVAGMAKEVTPEELRKCAAALVRVGVVLKDRHVLPSVADRRMDEKATPPVPRRLKPFSTNHTESLLDLNPAIPATMHVAAPTGGADGPRGTTGFRGRQTSEGAYSAANDHDGNELYNKHEMSIPTSLALSAEDHLFFSVRSAIPKQYFPVPVNDGDAGAAGGASTEDARNDAKENSIGLGSLACGGHVRSEGESASVDVLAERKTTGSSLPMAATPATMGLTSERGRTAGSSARGLEPASTWQEAMAVELDGTSSAGGGAGARYPDTLGTLELSCTATPGENKDNDAAALATQPRPRQLSAKNSTPASATSTPRDPQLLVPTGSANALRPLRSSSSIGVCVRRRGGSSASKASSVIL